MVQSETLISSSTVYLNFELSILVDFFLSFNCRISIYNFDTLEWFFYKYITMLSVFLIETRNFLYDSTTSTTINKFMSEACRKTFAFKVLEKIESKINMAKKNSNVFIW